MTKLRAHLSRLLSDESGTTAIEYSLIGVLISVVIIASVNTIGTEVLALFQRVWTALGSL